MVYVAYLFNASLLALRRAADDTSNLPPADVVLKLRDFRVKRVHLLLNLAQLRRLALLLLLVERRPLPLLPVLRLPRESRLRERRLELRQLRALGHFYCVARR